MLPAILALYSLSWLFWVQLLLLLLHKDLGSTIVKAFAVERRRYVLLPWRHGDNDNDAGDQNQKIMLGWATEERHNKERERWTVTVSCRQKPNEHTNASSIMVELPWDQYTSDENNNSDSESTAQAQYQHHDYLANALWPSGIAGAILCMRFFDSFVGLNRNNKNLRILELGSGLGLMGFAAGLAAANAFAHAAISVELTDHDAQAIHKLQRIISKIICSEKQQSEDGIAAAAAAATTTTATADNVSFQARFLEWRDNHNNNNSHNSHNITSDEKTCDIIVASDVAYYYYLLRPLMDTMRAYLLDDDNNAATKPAVAMLVGQANRQSQWDLYENIQHGCYNQLTDKHEPPWRGRTRMLLYRLQMSEWWTDDCTSTTTTNSQEAQANAESPRIVSTIPIALLLHERIPCSSIDDLLQSCDYMATAQDKEEMFMSF